MATGISLCITYTGTNATFNSTNTGLNGINTLYVDGLPIGQNTGSPNTGAPGLDLMIGNDPAATNNPYGMGQSFAGQICEAAFWNGVTLSSNQVAGLYNFSGNAPTITGQPVSIAANASSTITNSVTAFGSNPLFYQWYVNGQGLPVGAQPNLPIGATNAQLIFSPLRTNDASTDYYVVVTNAFGSVTSSVVSLTVFGPPNFTNEPILVTLTNNILLFSNAAPTFKVAAVGAQPLFYQWYTNGVPATSNSVSATNYTLTPVPLGGGGITNFFCVASNFLGIVTNNAVSVTGIPAPTAPYPVAVLAGNPIGYWRLDEPDNGLSDGNAGLLADDYWGGKNGIYTNTTLGQPGYTANSTPNTDPTETSASFGSTVFQDSDAYGIGGVDFSAATNVSSSFSVEAWVDGFPQTKDAGIVSRGFGNGGEQFNLDTGSDSGSTHQYRFFVRDAGGGTHSATSTVVPNSTWQHLVGVCDESNGVGDPVCQRRGGGHGCHYFQQRHHCLHPANAHWLKAL